MNKRNILFSLSAAAFMALIIANPAFAQDASDVGGDFFDSLQSMITGNVGFFIGLLVTVLGIWTWVIKQNTGAGVTMIIGGVLITLAPGLFNSARNFMYSAIATVGGDDSAGDNFTTSPGAGGGSSR